MPVERGQVWQLGRHRLMCGDATSRGDVETLLDGNMVDLLLTDPPYGISVLTDKKDYLGSGHKDDLSKSKWAEFFREGRPGSYEPYGKSYEAVIGDNDTKAARQNYELLRDKSSDQIIFGGNFFSTFLPPSRCWLIWDKCRRGLDFADGEMCWTSFDKNMRIYQWKWSGMIRQGKRALELKSRIHPTQKPVGLLQQILEDYSNEGATVVDCFAGSGSTLIACEVSNRTCYAMELSSGYCEKIIERWETLTGEKAVLVS